MYNAQNMLKKLISTPPECWVTRLVSAWCLSSLVILLSRSDWFGSLDYVSEISLPLLVVAVVGLVFLITLVNLLLPKLPVDAFVLMIAVLSYAAALLYRCSDYPFSLGVLVVLAFVGWYLLRDDKLGLVRMHLSVRAVKWLIFAAAVVYALFVGSVTVFRYLNHSTSTFDLGIFSQMFYYMKETGLPYTTCERDGLLSHFAVHVSPIYYLLLPGYFLFPSPIYLQIMQALVLASGVIPLYLLARFHGLGNKAVLALCVAYCSYPALMGGCFYDIHENLFLTPLLLWTLYFCDRGRFALMYVFAGLVLLVKEDAPIYIACIALYLIICCSERRLHGGVLMAGSLAYFFIITGLLSLYGEGPMVMRTFFNFITNEEEGLFGVIKTILLNPGYMIREAFTEDKIKFLVLMLLPAAGLCLFSRKLSRLFLLIPFLLVNLLPGYEYQHSIHFQYVFGSTALIFYLSVLNLRDMKPVARRYLLPLMVTASVMLCISNMSPSLYYMRSYLGNRDTHQRIDQYLSDIPEDASVQASGYYVPTLSQRKTLYVNPTEHFTEYIVLDLRPGNEQDLPERIAQYEEEGYVTIVYEEELIQILHYDGVEMENQS